MSANQTCRNCGLLDYAFMPVCVECGTLLGNGYSDEMCARYEQLSYYTKRAIHDLSIIQQQFYNDGIPEFDKRWEELQNIAFQLAFGFSHDAYHSKEMRRLTAELRGVI